MILRKFSPNSSPGDLPRGRGKPFRHTAVICLLALAGCAPVVERPSAVGDEAMQQAREAALALQPKWAFTGRLAISQGANGGNARVQWQQDGEDFEIRLSAPITRQSWRLKQSGGKVSLEGMTGGVRVGADAEAMLLEATGWRIPLNAMTAWVRGVRAQGPSDMSFDERGLPATIRQGGWAVEYRDWFPGPPGLPGKVFARQGDASVRLVIESWQGP